MPRSMPIFMSVLNRSLLRDTLDLRAEIEELAFDVLIPPPNVVRAVNRARPVGRQRGEDQRRAGAQVADLDLGAVERRPALDRGVVRVERCSIWAPIRSQLGQPLEAVLEDRLVDRATCRWPGSAARRSAAGGPSRGPGRARSRCRTAGSRRPSRPRRVDLDRGRRRRTGHAGPLEHVEERAHVVARRALERDLAAGDRGRHEERAGLDPVGHDVVLGAAQAALAVDLDRVRVACARRRRPSSGGTRSGRRPPAPGRPGRMTVWPSARVAASIAFSVPITVTWGSGSRVPRSRPGASAK